MEVELRTECCLAPTNMPHFDYCSAGADLDKVRASAKLDGERWLESYIDRSTESVRKRVIAASNGISH